MQRCGSGSFLTGGRSGPSPPQFGGPVSALTSRRLSTGGAKPFQLSPQGELLGVFCKARITWLYLKDNFLYTVVFSILFSLLLAQKWALFLSCLARFAQLEKWVTGVLGVEVKMLFLFCRLCFINNTIKYWNCCLMVLWMTHNAPFLSVPIRHQTSDTAGPRHTAQQRPLFAGGSRRVQTEDQEAAFRPGGSPSGKRDALSNPALFSQAQWAYATQPPADHPRISFQSKLPVCLFTCPSDCISHKWNW